MKEMIVGSRQSHEVRTAPPPKMRPLEGRKMVAMTDASMSRAFREGSRDPTCRS